MERVMDYDHWLSRVPDPHEFDDRDDDERPCEDCGALPENPCSFMCACPSCDKQRQREMDERERIDDGKVA
jgi:hypothetical protein